MLEWGDALSVLGWVCNVLLAAFIAFIFNAAYQSKREMRKSGEGLYIALCRWSDERDTFLSTILQAMSGTISYGTAVSHLNEWGLPSPRVITDIEVLIDVDYPGLRNDFDEIRRINKNIHDCVNEYAISCIGNGSSRKPVKDTEKADKLCALKQEFNDKLSGMKGRVKSEKLTVTWTQAIQNVLRP